MLLNEIGFAAGETILHEYELICLLHAAALAPALRVTVCPGAMTSEIVIAAVGLSA